MMAPTKIKLRLRKKEKSSTKSSQRQQSLRPETSPDSKCPICLDRFVNVASVERCLHRFCFRCIREWAKNKAECPLCKQPFRSIFHSVKAENDFKEFVVLEDNAPSATTSASATVAVTAAAIAAAPSGQNDTESAATRPRRSRATRTRRSQRAQDPAPSASSVDGVALDHATLVQRDPACLRQLLPWLRRERVMGANPSELRPFLLARTDHILHELVSFARSIEAMQCPPTPSYEEDSGSHSSIINISEDDDDDSEEADVTEDTTQDRVPPVPMATSSEISLSQSAWDDETPGPSYSTLGHPQTEEVEPEGNQLGGTSSATEQREHNDNDEEDECMIVGYVKPMAERTPELVQLSSDSMEEEEAGNENEASAMQPVMKAESSLPSQEQAPLSPKPYPSTSHTERGEDLEQLREQDPGKLSHHRRKHHTLRRGFRKTSHSLLGSRSQTSSESSPPSGHSIKISRSHVRLSCGEPRRHLSGRSPAVIAERGGSSSEELFPTHSVSARDKSSKSFSAWDSPGHDGERKKKRRKRRRERETERSRSPHRDSRHRHGDRELWLRSSCSSSSSDAELHREKPAGKRKYKTRHLERTARRQSSGKSRERERSPSVEIIFERRASDAHSRSRRRRKRSRRKEREQNSPTVITIDSDSGSDRTADRQNRLVDDDKDDVVNGHAVEYQDRTADDTERVTDFSDHTIDYQERLTEFSDRTADDKDCVTDGRNGTDEYRHGVQKVSDQAVEHQDHAVDFRSRAADYKHSVTQNNSNSADYKEVSSYSPDSKRRDAEVTNRTTDYQESLLDVDDSPDDFQDSVTEIRNRGESTASLLDMLNLEQCLVDVVQPIRRVEDDSHRASPPLSDTELLELEGSLLGEGQGALRNGTVDQQEAGHMAHMDQSETEHERDSRISEP